MRKMSRPTLVAKDVFTMCISRIRDSTLRQRLIDVTDHIAEASDEYDALAAQTLLYQIIRQETIGGVVTTAEMEAVYSQRMAKKGSPGREAYDELFNSAPLGKCPLCCQRTVSTLDHHLPKTHYPALAVVPLNLVPACTDCNKSKLATVPAHPNEEALHPYFDDIGRDRWLYAAVGEGDPAMVRFSVRAPPHWDEVLAARVARHFRMLSLGNLYSAEAADELLNIRHQLRSLHAAGGMNLVRLEMQARADSCRDVSLNGWRTATFEAFAQSVWFCDGGFD